MSDKQHILTALREEFERWEAPSYEARLPVAADTSP
jgi:hypothetical protein